MKIDKEIVRMDGNVDDLLQQMNVFVLRLPRPSQHHKEYTLCWKLKSNIYLAHEDGKEQSSTMLKRHWKRREKTENGA